MTDRIARLNGALEGRYRVERELGAGGMATVYLAHDVRHQRHVALKVLRPELAAVVGAERFLAEIRTTAGLQHPHILPLHDSGEADSFLFYVMPYVGDESLSERLQRERQLPVPEAVRIAKAVASALDYAHRHGVIHRDIKPANILLHDGEPVVADFGIALAVQQAGGGRLTETGLSLGTPHYMSPEQAMADRDPTAASDVYSLGCVLYEMLAGEPPFTGATAQAVLAKILTAEPAPPREVRKTVPPHVEAVLLRSLQKLPADRFESAAAFADALDRPDYAGPAQPAAARSAAGPAARVTRLRAWLPWGLFAMALLALGLVWLDARRSDDDAPRTVLRAVLELPANAYIAGAGLAFSPDGRRLVVVARQNGAQILLQRRLGDFGFEAVAGTNDGTYPFISADGQWVAFRAGTMMKRVPLAGGPAVVLDPEGAWAGGHWTGDGTVYYSRSYRSGVWRVSANGGTPTEVTSPDSALGELAHWYPQRLPDGEHLLFSAFRTPIDSARIAVVSLKTGTQTTILKGGVSARYVPTGHLLFARDEVLFAVPFDLNRLEVTGAATPVVDDLAMVHVDGAAAYAVANDGTLAYVRATDLNAPADVVWIDRRGAETPVALPSGTYDDAVISPDGRSVALAITEPGEAPDIWIIGLERATRFRLTAGGGADFNPVWTPDGRSLVYVSERPVFDVYIRPIDGSRPASPLLASQFDKYPYSFSPDGSRLVLVEDAPQHDHFLAVPLAGGTPDTLAVTGRDIASPAVSPDGRWIAFTSTESGRDEVYISPWSDPARSRVLVSTDGGTFPLWTRAGRELVYRSGDRVMAVSVDPLTGELGRPERLFEGPYLPTSRGARNWDVSADGERFLMVKRPPERAPRRVIVVTNFFEELRRRDPGTP